MRWLEAEEHFASAKDTAGMLSADRLGIGLMIELRGSRLREGLERETPE
jgi:hypothetical protein